MMKIPWISGSHMGKCRIWASSRENVKYLEHECLERKTVKHVKFLLVHKFKLFEMGKSLDF